MKISNKGQGLLEAVIATAIIATGLSAVIALTGNNVIVSNISAQQVIAVNLAREGIEGVKNIRDSNWLANAAFDNGLENGVDVEGVLLFDPAAGTWTLDFAPDDYSDGDTILYRNDVAASNYEGVYRQGAPGGYVASIYKRLITIYSICENNPDQYAISCGVNPKIGIRVLSEVQWSQKGDVRSISIEERFFDWK